MGPRLDSPSIFRPDPCAEIQVGSDCALPPSKSARALRQQVRNVDQRRLCVGDEFHKSGEGHRQEDAENPPRANPE
jgi:hypothetical protein